MVETRFKKIKKNVSEEKSRTSLYFSPEGALPLLIAQPKKSTDNDDQCEMEQSQSKNDNKKKQVKTKVETNKR